MINNHQEELVYGRVQNELFLLCGGGWGVCQGIQVSMGIMLNELGKEWNLSYIQEGIISTFAMIGLFIGFNFWGIIADKYGRMHSFQRTLLFVCIGSVLTGFSPEMWTLSVSCLLTGFGIGGSYAVDGTVFLEYCPLEKQYLLTAIGVLTAAGATLAPCLAWIFSIFKISSMWRVLELSFAVMTLLLLIPRFKVKETPAFLKLRRENSKKDALAEQLLGANVNIQDTEAINNNQTEISKFFSTSIKQQILYLFQRPLRFYTYLFIVIWGGTGFTFSGLASFIPIVLKRSGIHDSDEDIYKLMLYQQIVGIPAVVLAAFLVRGRLGRKNTLMISLFLAGFVLFGFLLLDYLIVMIFSLLYYFFQNMFSCVVNCISPETFPVEIRNTAVGVFGSVYTITSILAPMIAALVLNTTDDNFLFILFFSVSLMLAAISSIWIIETKGFNPRVFNFMS